MIEKCEEAKRTAGGPSKLAEKLGGLSSQAVSQWKRIPATRVIAVEQITGIPRHDLRPDLYPREGEAA